MYVYENSLELNLPGCIKPVFQLRRGIVLQLLLCLELIVMASVSASSHSMLTQLPKRYDVFISFRGEDTRNNFTSHLHAALCRRKIETYIDYRLEKGEELWPALEEAIENSYVFAVVFSENYASSTWCLNELTKIMKQRAKGCAVIPVFYKVDPSHVRRQKGSYGDAFAKHERNFFHSRKKLKNWRFVLKSAANLVGWDSCHGYAFLSFYV
ncbi:hypothetical protein L6164_032395 [Bauhinia variegata]|uniref:Uncharacterized protein n=1 Tax=Bauhinia variegata TaxID=167791 RepID=A0ACB9KNI8_BAUVA|nr:hypothetical protein L6164_032395 [Bauhinia variegata]